MEGSIEDFRRGSVRLLGQKFDLLTEDEVVKVIQYHCNMNTFRYVVTPNVAHVVSLIENPIGLRPLFDSAWMSLCDSRVLQLIAKLSRKQNIPVVTGSDLTQRLLKTAADEGIPVAILGASESDRFALLQRFPKLSLCCFDAPMGLRSNPEKRGECVDFVRKTDAKLVFLAVGMPQQEMIANEIASAGDISGVGLCIGASIDFLVGRQRRAPKLLQNLRLEWLFRLLSDPKRLARRYLLEGPRIFWYAFVYRDK